MSLKNLKATLIFKEVLETDKKQFKISDVSYTIYKHKRDRIHITGVKSMLMLHQYRKNIQTTSN